MGNSATPALGPSFCILAGATLAVTIVPLSAGGLPLAALLVGLGWAWGRRAGRLVAWTAVGMLLVSARPEAAPDCWAPLDLGRPVTVLGTTKSAWQPSDSGWRTELSVERVRQGPRVLRCHAVVGLDAGGEVAPIAAVRIRVKGFLKRTQPLRNDVGRYSLDPPWRGRYRMYLKSPRFVTAALPGAGLEGMESNASAGVMGAGAFGRRVREWVRESFAGVDNRDGVRAARALLLGDRAALDAGFQRSLRRFGLSHLFAVSGLHVALLGLLVHWILRGLRQRPRLVLTTMVVLSYLVLVGARPSIVRATAMFVLAFGAVWSQRPPHSRQALCLAAGALIALDPALISNLGFRLTVSATAGILWLSPALESRWVSLPRALRRPLAATVGAQLASLPWTVGAFSVLHPLAPVVNLVAVPWMAAFAMLSLVGSATMKCLPWTRDFIATVLDLGIAPIDWLDTLPASSWFVWPVATGFVGACLLAGSMALALLLDSTAARCIAACLAAFLLVGPTLPAGGEMIAIDVGQGDAILLHDGREGVLVDGGGWRTADIAAGVLVPTLARLGLRRLSAAIVTHPDVDHCRGLLELSYYVPIDRVLTSPGASSSPCVRRLVSRPGTRWRELWRGQSLRVGRFEFEVLHPVAGAIDRGNDSSLVLRAVLGERSVLLSGDIEARSERSLVARAVPGALRSHVLKLPHHGSKTSTTDRFLEAVAPKVAVVSSGRGNHYGHPAEEVVERCRRHGVRVLRTDRDGMIRLALEPHRPGAGRSTP